MIKANKMNTLQFTLTLNKTEKWAQYPEKIHSQLPLHHKMTLTKIVETWPRANTLILMLVVLICLLAVPISVRKDAQHPSPRLKLVSQWNWKWAYMHPVSNLLILLFHQLPRHYPNMVWILIQWPPVLIPCN